MEIEKIIAKADQYLNQNRYDEVERLLSYWEKEAKDRDLLPIYNEQLGLYRKTKQKIKALNKADETQLLLKKLRIENLTSSATIFINIATVYSAFGQYKDALYFYKKAEKLYEDNNVNDKGLLSSLYNNLGTVYTMLGQKLLSKTYFDLALSTVDLKLDKAITYLNLADLYLYGFEDKDNAKVYLDKAREIFFDTSIEKNGYYAFVAEKCAPGFKEHGLAEFAASLEKEAQIIYEGN